MKTEALYHNYLILNTCINLLRKNFADNLFLFYYSVRQILEHSYHYLYLYGLTIISIYIGINKYLFVYLSYI